MTVALSCTAQGFWRMALSAVSNHTYKGSSTVQSVPWISILVQSGPVWFAPFSIAPFYCTHSANNSEHFAHLGTSIHGWTTKKPLVLLHGPLTFALFGIVSMSWFTFTILNNIIMLWPPHLFTASNTPVDDSFYCLVAEKCGLSTSAAACNKSAVDAIVRTGFSNWKNSSRKAWKVSELTLPLWCHESIKLFVRI